MGIKQIGTGQSGLYQLNISLEVHYIMTIFVENIVLKDSSLLFLPKQQPIMEVVGQVGGWGWGGGQNHHRSETQPVARDLDVTQHQLFYRNTTTSPTTELLTTSRNRVFMCSYDLYSRTGCTTSSSLSTEAFYYLIISFNFTSDRAEVCGVGRV